jgi:squamous cell carcinoma antigen recognized by T-cells 3
MEEEQTLTLTSEAEREPEKDEATAMSDSSNDSDSDSDDEAQQNIQLQSLQTELAANPANYDAHLQVIPISLLFFSSVCLSNFNIFAS